MRTLNSSVRRSVSRRGPGRDSAGGERVTQERSGLTAVPADERQAPAARSAKAMGRGIRYVGVSLPVLPSLHGPQPRAARSPHTGAA